MNLSSFSRPPIQVYTDDLNGVIKGPFEIEFLKILNSLVGKRQYAGTQLHFVANTLNIGILKRSGWPLEWTGPNAEKERKAAEEKQAKAVELLAKSETEFNYPVPPLDYQKPILAKMLNETAYALLLEMGLGKTALLIWNFGILYKLGLVKGVVVVAPNGVHRQWAEDQIPEHLDSSIEREIIVWDKGKKPPKFKRSDKLTIFCINIDSAGAATKTRGIAKDKGRTGKGFASIYEFLEVFKGESFFILDESHMIKTPDTVRSRSMQKLGNLATYRRIATGTPISKHIGDAWAQFYFLDPGILKHELFSTFRAEFCVLGGWDSRSIVDSQNIEEFYSRIAPYSSRLTKKEAGGLPEKIYEIVPYTIGSVTERHYEELKKTYLTQMENGTIVDAKNATLCLMRLQQVLSGYLPLEDGTYEVFSSERIDKVLNLISQIDGQVNIWCRFVKDIERLKEAINANFGECVSFYGGDDPKERLHNLQRFLRGEVQYTVGNPQSGGTGRNEYRKCPNTIYFSNSFDALLRWQSEDRTHRRGMGEVSPTYFDLEALRASGRPTVDRRIRRDLAAKKSLSDLTFDEIRQALREA